MTISVRLKFKDNEGKAFSISMANTDPALAGAGGDAVAKAAINQLMLDQPFKKTIAECTGVDIVERTVKTVL